MIAFTNNVLSASRKTDLSPQEIASLQNSVSGLSEAEEAATMAELPPPLQEDRLERLKKQNHIGSGYKVGKIKRSEG